MSMENVEISSNSVKNNRFKLLQKAVATVWAAFQTNVALDEEEDEETTLDDY